MTDITNSEFIPKEKTAVALGLFDGVHKGHQLVIKAAVEYKVHGYRSAVFTFKTDTVTSKGHDGRIEMLLSDEAKQEHFADYGIDYLFSPDFSLYKDIPAEWFVRDILIGKLNCGVAVCGKDFRFGKGALGDSETLKKLCEKYGIQVCVIDQLVENEETVSSTLIRSLVRKGKIEKANSLLGYVFGFTLDVMHGKALGRTLDFPTINQYIPKGHVLPRFGVYCTRVRVNDKWYNGVTNIGIKPTVHIKTAPLAETFIINFHGDLYGESCTILLEHFVRAERKFDSIDELKRQIVADTEFVKEYYSKKLLSERTDENE